MAPLPMRAGLVALGFLVVVALGYCAAEAGAAEVPAYRVATVYALDRSPILLPVEMAAEAPAVIWCESRGNPRAVNRVSGAAGIFQLHPVHAQRARAMGYRWEQMLDPQPNADVASAIWREQGWAPWSCAP